MNFFQVEFYFLVDSHPTPISFTCLRNLYGASKLSFRSFIKDKTLRDTNFKKGDEEKNRRTKVASNPPIFEQDVRNRCLHTSLIFDFSFATYILRYGRSKNDLTRFPYRISVTRTCTPNFPEPAKNE